MKDTQKELSYEDVEIRGRMDIEDIVRLQINRCNASAYEPDQTLFESSVMVLLDLLPQHKRLQVLELEDEYIEEKEVAVYDKYWCGRALPSSLRLEFQPFIHYHELYRIILDAYAESGLTWQIEPELVERGKKPLPTIPTPVFKEEKKDATTD